MRLPAHVLDRVRGAAVVAAIATACGTEAPPPAAPAPAPPPPIVSAPAPIDPVTYASTDEAARLARLETENATALELRDRRIARVSAARRAAVGVHGGTGGGPGQRLIWAACGRG